MNKYYIQFVYIKGLETPCIKDDFIWARSKQDAIDIVYNEYNEVIGILSIDRQY